MEKENNKNILVLFGIVVLAFFGVFVKMNYSVDTYLLFASRNLEYIQEFIRSGRFFTAFFFKFLQILRFTPETIYTISFIIGIVSVTFSMYILYNTLRKYIKNDIMNIIISILIIINPFIIELWLFAEMGIMMISILACVLAFKHFDIYIEKQNIKELGLSIFFMIMALFSYQGTVALFVALSAISIIIHSNDLKKFIKNTAICVLCYGIPTLINFLIVMFIGNSRVGINNNILKTVDFILLATKKQMLQGFNLYPVPLFVVIHILALSVVLLYIIISKDKTTKKIHNILKMLYLLVITYIFTIATIIPQDVNNAVMFPRNSYAFGSIVGLMFLFTIVCSNNFEKIQLKNKIMIMIGVLLLIMEFIQFNIIGINRYIVNYMDKYVLLEVENKINTYEKDTGKKIEKIAIYNAETAKKFYQDINDMINVSAISEQMSRTAMIKIYWNRRLIDEQPNEEIYNKYFKNYNWNRFNMNQIVLEGNTIHWYLY